MDLSEYLDSGKCVDRVGEPFLKHFALASKACCPLYLASYLPIHHHGIHNASTPPHCGLHNGGWGDNWLHEVDETLLKHLKFFQTCFIHFIQACTAVQKLSDDLDIGLTRIVSRKCPSRLNCRIVRWDNLIPGLICENMYTFANMRIYIYRYIYIKIDIYIYIYIYK